MIGNLLDKLKTPEVSMAILKRLEAVNDSNGVRLLTALGVSSNPVLYACTLNSNVYDNLFGLC